ncbi:MAG: hypothetical protein JNK04_07635 [Myxococcales bacterium]|nr:hypothetical protein [Myxococcales bacterium]
MRRHAALACALVVFGCAKEGGERPREPVVYPPPPPLATAPPLTTTPPTATAPLPPPTASSAPVATASASAGTMSPKELFRAQDACLDHCDQFACMKVANAYKQGAGVPNDVLAGRRYAIHACLECGAPGLAIVDQCPSWGVSDAPGKKK